jgi:hypothetical protein
MGPRSEGYAQEQLLNLQQEAERLRKQTAMELRESNRLLDMKLKEQRAERGAKHQADASEKKAKKEAERTRKAEERNTKKPSTSTQLGQSQGLTKPSSKGKARTTFWRCCRACSGWGGIT